MKNNALQELRDKYSCLELEKFDDIFPVPVHEICFALGIETENSKDMSSNMSGYIKKQGELYVIKANKRNHPNRRRFTVAHELGHYLLHKAQLDKDGEILERSDRIYDKEKAQMEAEANDFAAKLLMPEEHFLKRYQAMQPDLESLSKYFFVSQVAIELRAINLGVKHGY